MHANARHGDTNMFLCLNHDIKRDPFEPHPLSHILSYYYYYYLLFSTHKLPHELDESPASGRYYLSSIAY